MKVAICTLGCKVNQYETQALEQELLHRGHTLVDFEETADAYVVNTCSVTAVSDKKSRQMLRQAAARFQVDVEYAPVLHQVLPPQLRVFAQMD